MDFTGNALLDQITHTPTRVSVTIPGTDIVLHGETTGEDVGPDMVAVRFEHNTKTTAVSAGRIN